MLMEEGKRATGSWVMVSEDEETEKDATYELQFNIGIIKIPIWIPFNEWFNEQRGKIIVEIIKKYQEFRGLEVIWWRLTDNKFNIQIRHKAPVEETVDVGFVWFAISLKLIVLATVAALGFVLAKGTLEYIKKLVPIKPIPWQVSLGVIVGGILILAYMYKPKKSK